MGLNGTARRRCLGVIALAGALLTLILGETVLKAALKGFGFVIYWLVCLGFTFLAMLVAFLDVRALGRRVQQERRELLQTTLDQIQSDANKKNRPKA